MLDSVYNLGYEQYSPKTRVNVLAGALFGVLVGVLVVFFLEWLEMDIIRSSDDVERILELPVLGTIPPASGDKPALDGSKRRQLVPGLRGTN